MALGTVEDLNMYETIIAETKKENLKRKVLTSKARIDVKYGSCMQAPGFRLQDADPGARIQDVGSRSRILDPASWIQDHDL